MEQLIKFYEELRNYPFPSSNIEDDELTELYSELVEVDSYYAGKINTMLNNMDNANNIDFSYLKLLRNKLDIIDIKRLSNSDKIKYEECSNYIRLLEKLPTVLLKRT